MSISVEKLREWEQSGSRPFVIDVRSSGEFASGHVPGAVHIPLEEAEARLEDIPAEGRVVLVCQSGDRAKITCELIRHERPNSEVLEGGTEAWVAAGLPTVCSRKVRWSLDRQVRLGAGILVLSGTLLSLLMAPGWIYLAMFVGAGLTFAGLTNVCGMASVLALMPWNRPPKSSGREVTAGASTP